jgi:hypothetical protein
VTAKDWEKYCQHVKQTEQYRVGADVMHTIIIANTNDSSDNKDTSSADDESEQERDRTLGHYKVTLNL